MKKQCYSGDLISKSVSLLFNARNVSSSKLPKYGLFASNSGDKSGELSWIQMMRTEPRSVIAIIIL